MMGMSALVYLYVRHSQRERERESVKKKASTYMSLMAGEIYKSQRTLMIDH